MKETTIEESVLKIEKEKRTVEESALKTKK